MTEYIVTARKWRPVKFEDVIGQSHVTVTLRNALESNRLAHAYIFSGPRGVGKTTTARLLAKAVNCRNPVKGNPDNECELCREIADGRSFDVFEIDGASNRGIEEIRSLREAVRYPPAKGTFKIYIIDEVHMLTKEAFNALLKTLEEPPRQVMFIFATTEIHKVPATIVSRCQRFEFRRLSTAEISGSLRSIANSEGVDIDEEALLLVAKKGDGSLRDAQSMFDQLVSLCGKKIVHEQILSELRVLDLDVYFRLTDLIKLRDSKGGLSLIDEVIGQGYDLKEFVIGLMEHLRNILVVKTTNSTSLVDCSDSGKKRYEQEAARFSVPDLLRLQRMLATTEETIRWSTQPRFRVEADFVQMISMDSAASVGELVHQIGELNKKKIDEEMGAVPSRSVDLAPSGSQVVEQNQGTRSDQRSPIQRAPMKSFGEVGISEEQVRSLWPLFLAEVRLKRISLGSVLEGTSVLGVKGDAVRVGCTDDFVISSIKRNKQALQEILQSVMNTGIHLEPERDPQLIRKGTPESDKSGDATPTEHPVVLAMMRELGAEPL